MQNIKTFIRMFSQLKKILDNKQKKVAVLVAFISMVVATLETMGVSVILPFVLAMLEPQTLLENDKLSKILAILKISDERGIITVTALLIVIVYAVKNLIIILSNRVQLNFRNTMERDLSVLMLRSYIYQPYSFFLNINSAEVMRGITSDISGVATVVDNYCTLFTEGLTCLLIGVLLIALNPVMACCLVVLAGVTAVIMVMAFKKQIGSFGVKCRDAFAKRYKHAYQAINGIKEISVMKRQDNFLGEYIESSRVACNYNTKYLWISKLPSRVIEFVFITGLIVIVLFSYNKSNDMTLLIAQFSAIAVASVRILPSVSSLANSMNSLVFQRPALESAYSNIMAGRKYIESIEETKKKSDVDIRFEKELKIDAISWKYKEDLPEVLNNLYLSIKPGEAIGLIGESGAGKTTLADIILGLFKPQKGTITVDERDIFDLNTGWHKLIGYVPQSVFLMDDTIKNNILFGIDSSEIDDARLEQAIDKAQLREFVEKQPEGINTVLGERGVKISGGQRQRIAIARALYYNPPILVLDEATAALDNETESAVIESINALQGEKTLIIIAHRLTTIANCDYIYEIKDGKAIARSKQEVLG